MLDPDEPGSLTLALGAWISSLIGRRVEEVAVDGLVVGRMLRIGIGHNSSYNS